jgi:uncharacterized protein (DUF4415 family)
MKKTLQIFDKEYLKRCKGMTPDQVVEFLENYRKLLSQVPEKSKLISLKIEPSLLQAFRRKSELMGMPYQTQIKKLMREWVKKTSFEIGFARKNR